LEKSLRRIHTGGQNSNMENGVRVQMDEFSLVVIKESAEENCRKGGQICVGRRKRTPQSPLYWVQVCLPQRQDAIVGWCSPGE
jgi:hypothetical protein